MTICFSIECASYNGNRPIRYCQQCHNIRHNNRRGGDHIFHRSLPQIWDMSPEMQAYLVDAIMRYAIDWFKVNLSNFNFLLKIF